ncbi:hypothetical protein SPOG_03063 [Schizosaccharomyces cryophilus OY26]|uniref:Stc1 domain-containing protein n=1 Tax=Schizosaccharomyces cryophilus (strain OY26 / ATCC MYA-4695 / CBS 11777 / NBRC 106824 / NRRL Y48691) TaxID=653667 RepID=S9W576_SCHCR|nr:uncharacterized protein SPOG_03063 [Schizosaccharomyces cryophilus OY26]EPY53704.1 hypothetical protein SPOG_03063 [Schizosaccharomyces cryophilus OY26]
MLRILLSCSPPPFVSISQSEMYKFGRNQESSTGVRNDRSISKEVSSTQKNNFLTCMRCKLAKGRNGYNKSQWQKGYRSWRGEIVAISEAKAICSSCQPKQADVLNCPACNEDKPVAAFSKSQRKTMAPRCQACVHLQRNDGIEDNDDEAFIDPFEDEEDDDFDFED